MVKMAMERPDLFMPFLRTVMGTQSGEEAEANPLLATSMRSQFTKT